MIARLIFISIFDGMLIDDSNKKKHLKAISHGFNEILKLTLQHDNVLMETIFETVFFHSSDIELDSQKVVIGEFEQKLSIHTIRVVYDQIIISYFHL